MWGALSDSPEMLIAARTLMGIGGALIMPSTLSILTNAFVDPKERKTAIGIWAGVSGLGIAVGPALGGWLLEHYAWGSVFLLNVPVVAAALMLGFFLVPESRDTKAPRLDLVGAALSATSLVVLVWAIIEAPTDGWTSASVLAGLTAGTALLLGFTWWEMRTRFPMLDVRLFRNRRFGIPALAITLVFFALFGSAFFLSIYLQTVLGYDALAAGIRILPIAAGIVFGAPLAMTVAKRIGEKWPTFFGLVLLSTSLWVMSGVSVDTEYRPRLLAAIVLLGFGIGFAMGPATESVMGSLPRAKAGVGSAVNDTVRQVGGALGVAVLGSILNSVYASKVANSPVELPAAARQVSEDNVQGAYAVAEQLPADAGSALVDAANHAFVLAVSTTVLVAAGVVLAGALLALVFMPSHGVDVDVLASPDLDSNRGRPGEPALGRVDPSVDPASSDKALVSAGRRADRGDPTG